MKMLSVITLSLVSIQLLAQGVTCVQFAKMDDQSAKGIENGFKQVLEIRYIPQKELKKEEIYINSISEQVKDIDRCVQLRSAYTNKISSFDRIKALDKLSTMKLSSQESKIYTKLLNENLKSLKAISKASLVSSNVTKLPLVYLSVQKTNKGLLVYEKRLYKGKLKIYYDYVDERKELPREWDTDRVKNAYVDYLNQVGAELRVEPEPDDIYGIHITGDSNQSSMDDREKTFAASYDSHIVTNGFNAKNNQDGKFYLINRGRYLKYEGKDSDEIFFLYNQEKYRIGKIRFKKNTKKLEKQQ